MSDTATLLGDAAQVTAYDLAQVDAWLTHLRHLGHPDTTINTYASPLRRAAEQLPHGLQATTGELEAWLGSMRLAPNTRAAYINALRRAYTWWHQTDRISDNPAAKLPPARQRHGRPRPVPLDQVAVLLTTARQPYRLWALIATYAGLRCCELAGLHREHISERALFVARGKGGRQRTIPTHQVVWQAVRELPPGSVCGGRSPKRVSAGINAECDRLGLPDVVAHRLRHTALSAAYAGSHDIRATQELAGHCSPATTAIYTLVSDDALRAAVESIPTVVAANGHATTTTAAARYQLPAQSEG